MSDSERHLEVTVTGLRTVYRHGDDEAAWLVAVRPRADVADRGDALPRDTAEHATHILTIEADLADGVLGGDVLQIEPTEKLLGRIGGAGDPLHLDAVDHDRRHSFLVAVRLPIVPADGPAKIGDLVLRRCAGAQEQIHPQRVELHVQRANESGNAEKEVWDKLDDLRRVQETHSYRQRVEAQLGLARLGFGDPRYQDSTEKVLEWLQHSDASLRPTEEDMSYVSSPPWSSLPPQRPFEPLPAPSEPYSSNRESGTGRR